MELVKVVHVQCVFLDEFVVKGVFGLRPLLA